MESFNNEIIDYCKTNLVKLDTLINGGKDHDSPIRIFIDFKDRNGLTERIIKK